MAASDFPEFDHHMRQQLGMMTELGMLLDSLENDAKANTLRHVDFLTHWYRRHADFATAGFWRGWWRSGRSLPTSYQRAGPQLVRI